MSDEDLTFRRIEIREYTVIPTQGPLILEGYLHKLKSRRTWLRSEYSRYWFTLDLNRLMFYYSPSRTRPKPARYYHISDITAVVPLVNSTDFKDYGICITVKGKEMILITESMMHMNLWIDAMREGIKKFEVWLNIGTSDGQTNIYTFHTKRLSNFSLY